MSRPSLSTILSLTPIRKFLHGETIDGHPNPLYLIIATRGYSIQSRILHLLHLPNWIGFFSPGSPRLQTRQAALFGVMLLKTCFDVLLGVVVVSLLRVCGLQKTEVRKLAGVLVFLTGAQIVGIWGMACLDRRGALGYDWGQGEGKMRRG
ncbi:hypothetical protein K491DRAFT_719029 [Lophiostoma macrostomum CBS 122681]|uniref:Uncharacterized protein n=1 Tax=Lophiostoma macrostomum CBS 122681 TaxID=1314788 RepID=A0A6A6T0E6_9PLEO|nr:hypothetical protein K491DRAFT_719029 [Lophiostoma macrostomum CBS 122681]